MTTNQEEAYIGCPNARLKNEFLFGKMPVAERKRRNENNRQKLLSHLSFETWSDIRTCSILLQLSESSTRRLLHALVREKLAVREDILVGSRGASHTIYGITGSGICACGHLERDAREHQTGELRVSHLNHSLGIKRIKIILESNGWTNFISSRSLQKKS